MTLISPRTVVLENSVPSFGDSMRKIRSWLDHNKIQPVTFKIISAGVRRLNLNLIFAPKIKPSYSSENLTNHQVPDY